jgi:predicted permease
MNFDLSILGALIPVFLVIFSGYVFRRFRFPGENFWTYAERITYFVLFPSLLLQRTATARLDMHTLAPMVAALVAVVLAMTCLLLLTRPWWKYGAAAFTSFFQGGIRFNTYVGLSAAFALFGDEGLTLAALAIAVLIPLINVLCVTVLVVSAHSHKKNWHSVPQAVIRNPLILACTGGILLNIFGIGIPAGIGNTFMLFGRASLPLGLMALGAALDIAGVRTSGKIILSSCVIKLAVMPAFMWAISQVLGLDHTATAIAVLFAALPGSPTSYILARQLGGDSLLMANIVTAQVVFSLVTLPVVMTLLIA